MKDKQKYNLQLNKIVILPCLIIILVLIGLLFKFKISTRPHTLNSEAKVEADQISNPMPAPSLNFLAYDAKLLAIANNPAAASGTPSSTVPNLWPVKTVYPNYGALLPFNRIVAYYGNLYSKNMGVLGEYSEEVMLEKLNAEVQKWQAADQTTPVIPALHYIAVVAQSGGGRDGKFRTRMPDTEIQKVLDMAKKINAIVFLDIQLGQSDIQTELPFLKKYLILPQVHLGIDPEFAMHNNAKPGTQIGSLDASDINFAANYLADIVKQNNLPPKILIIHRFTKAMVSNSAQITPLPEVQIVMNMDGFGGQANKINTYKQYIYKEPVQFTGFKLFYKNDNAPGKNMLTPEQLLKLSPIPLYIQFQ